MDSDPIVKKKKSKYVEFDLTAEEFFRLSRQNFSLETIHLRVKSIKKAIRVISESLRVGYKGIGYDDPLPLAVKYILMELASNSLEFPVKKISEAMRDFIEASVRIYILKFYLAEERLDPKYEKNILYTFLSTLEPTIQSLKGKDKELEEEEEEEEVELIIPYRGPLDPNEMEPMYYDMFKARFDMDKKVPFDKIINMLDLHTYMNKMNKPDKVRKREQIMRQRSSDLQAYSIKVWNYMTVKRSQLDKKRMDRYHQYFSGARIIHGAGVEKFSFVANLNASNLTDAAPPGYYEWFLRHADRIGTLSAVDRLWIRNNILLSSPHFLMMMHHQILHLYTRDETFQRLNKPFLMLPYEAKEELIQRGGIHPSIAILRLRSDFDNVSGAAQPQKLVSIDKIFLRQGGHGSGRLDPTNVIITLNRLGRGINRNGLPDARIAIKFLIAAGGHRIGLIPRQPVNPQATPFLQITWLVVHTSRIMQWKAWAEADPEHVKRLKAIRRRR